MGGILGLMEERGVGCMAGTYVGILEPKGSSRWADAVIFVGLARVRYGWVG